MRGESGEIRGRENEFALRFSSIHTAPSDAYELSGEHPVHNGRFVSPVSGFSRNRAGRARRRCVTVGPHVTTDTTRFIETRCGERAPIYVPGPVRKRSEESFHTENKGAPVSFARSSTARWCVRVYARRERRTARREKERQRGREGEHQRARSSRGAINRRKQSLISWNFNSQSVKRACSRYGRTKRRPRILRKAGLKCGKRIREA